MTEPAVSIDMDADGGLAVALRGEIDFTRSGPIGDAIRVAVQRKRPALVRMNLAEVTFLDSSGIGVLVTAMRAADEAQAHFRVENPIPSVLDQLRLTGLLDAFGLAGRAGNG
jgi:anti-sigma B factor antagonist